MGSLVHPSILPMRESGKLYRKTGGDLLVVNEKGFDRAIELGLSSVNVVISPHDGFNKLNQKNTYQNIMDIYQNKCKDIPINRLYISCAFSEGISREAVLECVEWEKT